MQRFAFIIFFSCLTAFTYGQSASFSYSSLSGTFCNPDTVKFRPSVSGSPKGFIWNFGNGKSSSKASPLVVYTSPGTYKVKLTVLYSSGTVQVTNDVIINAAVGAAFNADNQEICKPGNISFTATGAGPVQSYIWDYGDGTLETTTSATVTHAYTNYGTFAVNLTVQSLAGCSRSSSQVVTVKKPEIDATISAVEGCIPAGINFLATVSTIPGDAVSAYLWDFGNGTTQSTASGFASQTYTSTGIFNPKLQVTTANGCTNTYDYGQIGFGIPPTNLVAYTPKPVICGSESPKFIAKADNANFYIWDNTETIDVVSDTVTTHKFNSLGTKNIVVTPSFNGCLGVADSFNIKVEGVIAKFSFSNSCYDRKTFSLINKSLGNISSSLWNFNDGTPPDPGVSTVHVFPDTGSFRVTLNISDNITGCLDSSSQTIYTANPTLLASAFTVCRNDQISYEVINSYNSDNIVYRWNLYGRFTPTTTNTIAPIARTFGNFQNYVVIRINSSYCPDTLYLTNNISVIGPALDFNYNDSFCLNTPLVVQNLSKPFRPADTITEWVWNFGDGDKDSTFQPPAHEYSLDGNYRLRLSATDINGCSDVLRKTIHTSEEAFVFTLPKIDTLCLGQANTLIAFQNDSLTWSPGTGLSCTTCDTTLANPIATTTYYATSTNKFGCSAVDSVLVKVYSPITAITATPDVYLCINDSVQINAGPPIYKIAWSPNLNITDVNSYDPYVYPSASTTYIATLSDSVGCFTSSVDVNVHIKSLPAVDAGPDAFYPYNSAFTITPTYSNNTVSYLWTPSSQLNCTTCASPNGTVLKKQTYMIEVRSDSGCVAKDSITIFVECKDSNFNLPNAFTPNGDNLNDYFYPLTRGIDKILNFSIYSREGKRIFTKLNFPPNDKSFGWDGNIQGVQSSTAVYVYTVDALCDSGEILHKKGSVVIIK
jgi:gliding motility-associated-like protein